MTTRKTGLPGSGFVDVEEIGLAANISSISDAFGICSGSGLSGSKKART